MALNFGSRQGRVIPRRSPGAPLVVFLGLMLGFPPPVLAQQPSPAAPTAPVVPAPQAPNTPSAPAPIVLTAPPVTVNMPSPPPAPTKSWDERFYDAVPGLLISLIGIGLAWWIGLRLTAGWDLRKKRAELDLQLIQEFNKIVADFKAIGREREVLGARLKATRSLATNDKKSLDEAGYDLIKRAIAAESSLEAILLKLVPDTDPWLEARHKDATTRSEIRKQQFRTMGLLRVTFRNLREMLSENLEATPGFADPELWLFNRLAADLAGIIHQRAMTPILPPVFKPWKIISPTPKPDPAGYLELIAYRTIDLRTAVAAIIPEWEVWDAKRRETRRQQRMTNIDQLFDPVRIRVLEYPPAPVTAGVTTVLEFLEQRPRNDRPRDEGDVLRLARHLFEATPSLSHYLGIVDGPPRLLIVERGKWIRILTELSRLPDNLPYSQPIATGTPPLALKLLGWNQNEEMISAIRRVAVKSLVAS